MIGFNRYNAWYSDSGHLEIIGVDVRAEAEAWRQKHNKPVMMTEYGADTMPGLHIVSVNSYTVSVQRALIGLLV